MSGKIQLADGGATGGGTPWGGIKDAGKVVLIDPVTGLPYGGSGGGGGGGATDLLFIDDSATQFVYRDNGATPPVFTAYKLDGTAYTVSTNPRPYSVRDVNVSTSALPTGASTASKQDAAITLLTTAVSDLAAIVASQSTISDTVFDISSQLPSTLGPQAGQFSISLVFANDTTLPAGTNKIGTVTVANGTGMVAGQTVLTTAGISQVGSATSKPISHKIRIKAAISNVGVLTFGASGVTNAIDGTGTGYPLTAGETLDWDGDDVANLRFNGTATGDFFSYFGN